MQAFSVTTAHKAESKREDRYYLAVTLEIVPRSAPISSTLNTGCNDHRRGRGGGGEGEETSHRNAVSLMDENSNDRENRRSLAARPFRSIDSDSLCPSLAPSLRSPLLAFPNPFRLLAPRFPAPISHRWKRSSILDVGSYSLSLSLSQSAVDFLVHRPNFPGRHGQFNTGLPSTSPCQIGGRPLFQCLSWDKGQNRFLRAPQSGSCGRYSNRGGS